MEQTLINYSSLQCKLMQKFPFHFLPGVIHDVLYDLVQDLLEEGGANPDVLDGLSGEGLGGATCRRRPLPLQGLLTHTLGPLGSRGEGQRSVNDRVRV